MVELKRTMFCNPCTLSRRSRRTAILSLFAGAFLAGSGWAQTQQSLDTAPAQSQSSIWEAGVGEGFMRHAHELNLSAGLGLGMKVFGGTRTHDWVLGSLEYGTM